MAENLILFSLASFEQNRNLSVPRQKIYCVESFKKGIVVYLHHISDSISSSRIT